jgi:hypothetical protein
MVGPGLTAHLRRSPLRDGDDAMHRDTRIAIAQNLVRIYRHVLEQPVPPPLLDLLNRLQAQEVSASK